MYNIKKFIAKNIFLISIWIYIILFWIYFPTWIYDNTIKFNTPLIDTIIVTTFFTMIIISSILVIYFSIKDEIKKYLLERLI